MNSYSRAHLSDHAVISSLAERVAAERQSLVDVLADIAEVDARQLYRQAAHPSMHSYCVGHLHMSDQAACKRIRVARAARAIPAIFEAIAEGRLHLSGAMLLTSKISVENATDLLAAATHKTCAEIEVILAHRFPKEDVATSIRLLPVQQAATAEMPTALELSTRTVESVDVAEPTARVPVSTAPALALPTPTPRTKITPLSPQRYSVHFTMPQEMRDDLRLAEQLLGHAIPRGDVVQILGRALRLLVQELQKQKFAATDRPRKRVTESRNPRHVPAHVQRSVWEREGGQCAFVSDSGARCPERSALEYDHVEPVARGGTAAVDGIRLLCRAHNQLAAEQVFGRAFMERNRLASPTTELSLRTVQASVVPSTHPSPPST